MKVALIMILLLSTGCQNQEQKPNNNQEKEVQMMNKNGTTLQTRILVPSGYKRTQNQGLTKFLREYSLKEDGSPVLLYDGSEKGNQSAHIAVMKLPLENKDLQQCADSIMRIYAEYYYHNQMFSLITCKGNAGSSDRLVVNAIMTDNTYNA